MSYLDNGFDQFFTRVDDAFNQAQEQEYQSELLAYGIPANNIVGGVLQSTNGNLTIDLNQGAINYNDGTTDLLTVGGMDNSININNSNANSILNSITNP